MRRARSVETVSLLVEDIAASAVSGCDVLHAGCLPWARTTATCAAKPSNPNSQTRRDKSAQAAVFVHQFLKRIRDLLRIWSALRIFG
jgi:hypothetical protein